MRAPLYRLIRSKFFQSNCNVVAKVHACLWPTTESISGNFAPLSDVKGALSTLFLA
jgi:hypothetical protein